MKKTWVLLSIGIVLFSENAIAYDNKVAHKEITDNAITSSIKTHEYLIDNLNLPMGIETFINAHEIRKWLKDGSMLEDEPGCRASNHFHNPLRDWDESGMRDQPWFVSGWCSGGDYPAEDINSAVHWATGHIAPVPPGDRLGTGNEWNWFRAREHFYTYLTGHDFYFNTVADTVEEREEYFAKSLRALGQVLHLLQDMAVPAHVRDDFKSHLDWVGIRWGTSYKPWKWISEEFEHFV